MVAAVSTVGSQCESCGARILWARTGSDKLMPVDAEPVPDGNVEIDESPTDVPDFRRAKVWGTAHRWPDGMPRYRAHFVTCPQASSWRRSS